MRYKLFVLLFFVALLPIKAQAQNQIRLHWDRYDTVVTVNPDGSMDVQEQQVLVVDQGRLSRMTRNFTTGDQGRVTNIQVLEDDRPYSPGRDTPGTFSGVDAGDEAQIQLWFRDPDVNRHTFTIAYTVNNTLIDRGDQATLDWSFFWGSTNAPEIRDGSVEIRFPTQINASELRVDYAGAPVQAVSESNPLRLELTDPIQGDELRVQATFPRAALAANAAFRSAQTTTRPRGNQPVVPAPNPNTVPAPAGGGFDFMFCFVVLIFLMIAFSTIRSSARRRQSRGYPTSYGPGQPLGPDPFFGPAPRGRRRRRYGGWGGGWGGGIFPPIIITPPAQPHDHDRSYGSPFDGTPNGDSGGSGSSWGDSGGSGSSWGDSGGSGSSWGDSGGGGSSWSDMGGGGSSWGGGGGGDSGGGGDNGGSGGGSFG